MSLYGDVVCAGGSRSKRSIVSFIVSEAIPDNGVAFFYWYDLMFVLAIFN